MIANDFEVNFVHPWNSKVYRMIKNSLVVDKNMIADTDDLEVNFVNPGNSQETEIKLKSFLGH